MKLAGLAKDIVEDTAPKTIEKQTVFYVDVDKMSSKEPTCRKKQQMVSADNNESMEPSSQLNLIFSTLKSSANIFALSIFVVGVLYAFTYATSPSNRTDIIKNCINHGKHSVVECKQLAGDDR